MVADVFEGFEVSDVPTRDGSLRVRVAGAGTPVLLLHGFPETGLMWHRVAPALTRSHTVVVSDLRGFGDSAAPPSTSDHSPYSMRSIAGEQVEMMAALGHPLFAVVGHDRGARCAYRLALDHPEVVTRLGVLDVVPTAESFDRADADFALGYWVWSFLAAPEPVPEQLLTGHARLLVDHMLDDWSDRPGAFSEETRAAYARALADPATAHAVCEEYRAAATLDREHDAHDRAEGHQITCPTLVLWASVGATAEWYEPLEIWREWATDVRGRAIDSGHFLPEEAPDETLAELLAFLQT